MTNVVTQKELNKWQNKINKRIKYRVKHGYYDVILFYHYIPDCICNTLIDYYTNLGYEVSLDIDNLSIRYNETYQLLISWTNSGVNNE